MVLVDLMVNACVEHYKTLPKTGKPSANEWTVISAIVGIFDNEHIKVLSLGTGSKCIGKSSMSSKGDILNDSHSEVIARRAFLKFLYLQIIQLNLKNTSGVLEKDDKFNFRVKDSVKFYFITGMSPCGDASIMPKTDSFVEDPESIGLCLQSVYAEPTLNNELKRAHSNECLNYKVIKTKHADKTAITGSESSFVVVFFFTEEKDIHRTGAKCLPESGIQDPHLPGVLYHSIGAVRTKPGRGDPTLSLSCSDKIAKWNAVGWQGALLSLFIPDPIFVEAIVCGGNCPFSQESFDRAVNERIKREHFIPIYQSSITFPDIKDGGKKPNPSSIIWCDSDGKVTEVSINGRKLGVTKKNINKKIARTSICKKELFILFEKALNSFGDKGEYFLSKIGLMNNKSIKQITYGDLKSKAARYQNSWKLCKEKFFKIWSNKPASLLEFTLEDEE